jgi:peptide/nickel transport system permease protein
MTRLAGPIIVGLTILGAILGPFVVPYDPAAQDLPLRLTGPSWSHPLGMDELGRDLLSRLMAGARISLLVGLAVVGVSSVVGTIVGALAGYLGGWRSPASCSRSRWSPSWAPASATSSSRSW